MRRPQLSPPAFASVSEEQLRRIVTAAVLAPSGGNSQPWQFVFENDHLSVLHLPHRSKSFLDYQHLASIISCGAAVENMAIAAEHEGFQVEVAPFPDEQRVARLRFEPMTRRARDEALFEQIAQRVTNRKVGHHEPLIARDHWALKNTARELGANLNIIEAPMKLRALADVLGAADRLRFLSRTMHEELVNEIRWSAREAEETRDGLDVQTLELNSFALAGLRLASTPAVMQVVARLGGGPALERPTRVAVMNASAVGMLRVPGGNTPRAMFEGGRALQRVWLTATRQGYSLQPMTALVCLFWRLLDGGEGLSAVELRQLGALRQKYLEIVGSDEGDGEVMLFRLARADAPTARSLRRPLDEFLTIVDAAASRTRESQQRKPSSTDQRPSQNGTRQLKSKQVAATKNSDAAHAVMKRLFWFFAMCCSAMSWAGPSYDLTAPPSPYRWTMFCMLPDYYDTGQAACNALAAYMHYPRALTFVVDTLNHYVGRCADIDENGEHGSMGRPLYGQECPPGYTMENSEGPVGQNLCNHPAQSYGANQACVASAQIAEVDRRRRRASCAEGRGNPIFPLTGIKKETVSLGITLGSAPLTLTYDNIDQLPMVGMEPGNRKAEPATMRTAGLGASWSSSLHRRARAAGVSSNDATLSFNTFSVGRADGSTVMFRGKSDTDLKPEEASSNDAALDDSTYFDAQSLAYELFSNDRLSEIRWLNGDQLRLFYSDANTPSSIAPAPGYLVKATDNRGRTVSFEYTLPAGATPTWGGLLTKIIDPANRFIRLDYDGASNLKKITWQDSTSTTFIYDKPGFPLALTGIVNERNVRYASFEYDNLGRATATQHAGGVNRYAVSYGAPPTSVYSEIAIPNSRIERTVNWVPATTPTVTGPLFSEHLANTMAGETPRISGSDQPAGAGCGPASRSQSFDARGNVIRTDDFNGHRTCFTFLTNRNLESSRVEGLSNTVACEAIPTPLPTGARRITTTWHPVFPLPTQTAAPGLKTTFVYHGQPDPTAGNVVANCASNPLPLPGNQALPVLCKKIEQATLDKNGSTGLAAALDPALTARVSKWTYDSTGQVLTATDARGYSTIFGRVPAGDLDTITNAKSQVTKFLEYDGFKHPTKIEDPNHVITQYGYDERGRLSSVKVGTRVTTYTYWVGNLLDTVTSTAATPIHYTYDDAQRLIRVSDELGNRIEYTLDNAGNRIEERSVDPAGLLKTKLTQTRDALGRVQIVTGNFDSKVAP